MFVVNTRVTLQFVGTLFSAGNAVCFVNTAHHVGNRETSEMGNMEFARLELV